MFFILTGSNSKDNDVVLTDKINAVPGGYETQRLQMLTLGLIYQPFNSYWPSINEMRYTIESKPSKDKPHQKAEQEKHHSPARFVFRFWARSFLLLLLYSTSGEKHRERERRLWIVGLRRRTTSHQAWPLPKLHSAMSALPDNLLLSASWNKWCSHSSPWILFFSLLYFF